MAGGVESDAAVAHAQGRPPIPPTGETPATKPASTPTAPAAPASTDAAGAGIKLAHVSATGEACPAGSYTAKLSEEGRLFSVQLTKFRPLITPAEQTEALACNLAIVIDAPVGTSYQVDQFSYAGYAYLEEGVSAELSTSYYFQADQSKAEFLKTSLTGPYDNTYTIDDKSGEGGLWSPCRTTSRSTLNVQLHVALRNGTPARDGTFEVNEAVAIALRWRKCDVGGTPAVTPDAGRSADVDSDSDEDRSRASDEDSDDEDDEDWSSDESSDDGWWWWSRTPLRVLRWLR